MAPRSLFEKFGHKCEIQSVLHDLPMFKNKHLKSNRYFFERMRMINETNKRGYNFLRSQKKIENEHRKQLLYPLIIHPFSDLRRYWELFMSLILMIQFYTIPLHLASYNAKFPDNYVRTNIYLEIRVITDLISLIDIIISFFSGYCDKKHTIVIMDPKKIARHYIGSKFLLDLYSSIPTDVILVVWGSNINSKQAPFILFVLHFAGIIKLIRYYYFIKYCSNFIESTEIPYVVFRIFIAFVTFITYLHVMCCCCIAWTLYEKPWDPALINDPEYLKSYGPNMTSYTKLYIRFFYCSCLLVLNSGYGFTPSTNISRLFTVFTWLLSRFLYILTIAYFMELHTAIQSSSQKYIDMLSEVKDYMRHRQIPDFLQKRILSYYDIKFQNSYFQESEILNTISGQLRQEIIMNTCRKLVENVAFFQDLPLSLLIRIVSSLKYEIFLTNDVITKAGTIGDSMYFISSGTVAIYTKSGKEICHLQDGDHFGEVALVMKDSVRVATVIAAEVCELYRLDQKDFVRAILPYPDILEKIIHIASDRIERTDVMDDNRMK